MTLKAHTCCSRSDKAFFLPFSECWLMWAGDKPVPMPFELCMSQIGQWVKALYGPAHPEAFRRDGDVGDQWHSHGTVRVTITLPTHGWGCPVKCIPNGFPGKQQLFLNPCCSELVLTETFQTLDLEDLLPQHSLPLLVTVLQCLIWIMTTQSSSYLLGVLSVSQPGNSSSYTTTFGDAPLWKWTGGKPSPDPGQEDTCAYFSLFLTLAYY